MHFTHAGMLNIREQDRYGTERKITVNFPIDKCLWGHGTLGTNN